MGYILESYDNVVGTDGESLERNKKQKENLDYINNHILGVKKMFIKYFVPIIEKNKTNVLSTVNDVDLYRAIRITATTIKNHDASKYDDDEFEQYRLYYYPTSDESARGEDFRKFAYDIAQEAFKRHYKKNKHHIQYWYDETLNEAHDMDLPSIIEMICDWLSVGYYAKEDTVEWYENKATVEKSMMTRRTKEIVEDILYHIIKSS